AAVQWLRTAIQKQSVQKQSWDRLEERLIELREQREQLLAKRTRHNEQAALWFGEADAADETEWERLLAEARQARRLQDEAIRLEVELSAGMTADKRSLLDKQLREQDEPSLASADKKAAEALGDSRKRHAALLEQRGRLLQTSEQLKREDDRRHLLQQRESAIAKLQSESARYAELAVMTALIRRTKKRLEDERQPAVLREASRLAAQLTEGRYVRIIAPPGEGTIRLENADGAIVDASFLSRGTAEQIYLALRLALADAVESQEPLPMLLDDLFVNFDGGRLRAAAGVLDRLSTDRQLILLTCHDHIASALTDVMPQAKTVALS
ncbi:ATP-binding protein, partial [Paenibacillus darwinianus]